MPVALLAVVRWLEGGLPRQSSLSWLAYSVFCPFTPRQSRSTAVVEAYAALFPTTMPSPLLVASLLVLISCLTHTCSATCSGSPNYSLTFDFNWSFETDSAFPKEDPLEDPGFSPVVCASHSSDYTMWEIDTLLSDPMAKFVRDEDPSALRAELRAAKLAGTVLDFTNTSEASNSVGQFIVYLPIDPTHTFISCASKIIPSPAWFIGIVRLDTCGDDGFVEADDTLIRGLDGGLDTAEDYTDSEPIGDDETALKVRRLLGIAPNGYGTLYVRRQPADEPIPSNPEEQDASPNAAKTSGPAVDAEDQPICVDANMLRHLRKEDLLFPEDRLAHVLCDQLGSCATPGHIVVHHGYPKMMKSYCKEIGECVPRVMLVNSPRYSQAMRVKTRTQNLHFTAFAARYATRAEESVLSLAVRVGL